MSRAAEGLMGEAAVFRVVVIREGPAKSGRFFSRQAIEDVARLVEGARAFADHATLTEERERPVRSVRDVVGVYHVPAVRVGPDGLAEVEAQLHVFESASWLRELAGGALALGEPGVIGLSIDALAVVRPGTPVPRGLAATASVAEASGTASTWHAAPAPSAVVVPVVEKVLELKSVDVVTRPSAGGRFLAVVQEGAMAPGQEVSGEVTMDDGRNGRRVEPEVGTGVQEEVRAVVGAEAGAVDVTELTELTGLMEVREVEGSMTRTAADAVSERTSGTEAGAGGDVMDAMAAGAVAGRVASAAGDVASMASMAGVAGVAGDVPPALAAILAEVREAQRAIVCRQVLDERLSAADRLPEAVVAKLRRQLAPEGPGAALWRTREAYAAAVDEAISAEAEALEQVCAQLGQLGQLGRTMADETRRGGEGAARGQRLVTGFGAVRVAVAEAEKQQLVAQIGMDRLLGFDGAAGGDPDWRRAEALGLLPGAPRWLGIREAYVALTGDGLVSGAVHPEGSIVREANEVTTGVLNQALLNSMTKRLVADYRGQAQDWRKFCTVVPLANFKSQDRVKLHDFASLSTVNEGAAYTNLAWDDTRENYAPAKRGNLVVVTREAILNDDLRAIRRIPQKLARAAGVTINEFVYALFTGNPFMSDGSKVFDDGVQTSHGNRGTSALSATALQAAITTMLKQTDSAGKRLNLKPRYLLVPADLLFTALTIVNSTLVPGSANNDANVLKGAVEPVSVAQFTDVNDWYLIADPADIESIEVGFVGGREEPELLLQDAPLHGQVFTNDQISFKVRWEFGGGWLDYRGAYWSQAA